MQLKERLEKDIYSKLENKTKLLKEQISQNEKLNKEIKSLNGEKEKLKLLEEEFSKFREKFNSLIIDKSKIDILSVKQEEKIKNLEEEISILTKECKEKDNRYKKLDEIYLGVIKVIEEHKKIIQNLKNKIKIKENEEKNKKLIIFQKDQEILLLRNFINSYKIDAKNKFKNGDNIKSRYINDINFYKPREFPNLHKNKSSIDIKNKNEFSQKINKSNNFRNLPKLEILKNNKTKFNESNYKKYLYDIDDKEEENIKEITNLMKKMVNE